MSRTNLVIFLFFGITLIGLAIVGILRIFNQDGLTSELKNLRSSVVNDVLRGILKSFPLSKFLEQWMGSFIGDTSDLKIEEITTTSSQKSSAGRKKK